MIERVLTYVLMWFTKQLMGKDMIVIRVTHGHPDPGQIMIDFKCTTSQQCILLPVLRSAVHRVKRTPFEA